MRLAWLVAGSLLLPAGAQAADPSALWKIVSGQCVPHEQAASDPAPCAAVDITGGFAVLKDLRGVAQYLLIPTTRVGGIEDPAILAPGAPNYWDDAWQARSFVAARLHKPLPRNATSLAINSLLGRTQNQLHIHIDCVRPDVRELIKVYSDKLTNSWTDFPVPVVGHHYRALRINQDSLVGIDPFHLLADADPGARSDMGMHTLVLVGATFGDASDGFVLLDGHVDLSSGDLGSGEQLQDHECTVAG